MNTKKLNRWNGRMNPTGTDGHRITKVVRNAALALGIATLNWLGAAPAGAAEPGTFAFTAASESAKAGKLSLGLYSTEGISAEEQQKSAALAAQMLAPLNGAGFGWFSDALATATAKTALVKSDTAPAGAKAFASTIASRLKEAAMAVASAGAREGGKVHTAGNAADTKDAPGKPVSRVEVEAQLRKLLDVATSWMRNPGNSQQTASVGRN